MREDALPIVSYKTTGYQYQPLNPINRLDKAIARLGGGVRFIVSTTNEALTSELCYEISSVIIGNESSLKELNCNVNAVAVSELNVDGQRYYVGQVEVSLSLGMPMWTTDKMQSILREIRISLDGSFNHPINDINITT